MAEIPIMSQVELFLSCENLPNLDTFSLSDPLIYVYCGVTDPMNGSRQWKLMGRTECIRDNLNPRFVKSFAMDYFFEEIQPLRFAVVDVDDFSDLEDPKKHDAIGEIETTLSEIVGSRGSKLVRELANTSAAAAGRKSNGRITVLAEEVQNPSADCLEFECSARGLDKKCWLWWLSDPYLVLSRCNEDGSYSPVHKSQVLRNTLDPDFGTAKVPLTKLCNGDAHRLLRAEVWHQVSWLGSGDTLIGACETTLQAILESQPAVGAALKHPDRHYHTHPNSGTLFWKRAALHKEHSFLEYIRGGHEICLSVAIDFTASNGNPAQPSSLHFMHPSQPNEYLKAILAVGNILKDYDSDQMFPVYGFGGRVPPSGMVSHCFALNFNEANPEVAGIEGIVQAYKNAIGQVALHGPTHFSQIIRRAADTAMEEEGKYHILLIITDGIINDMQQTIDEIVRASALPLSIIIVGVGQADFANMDVLDADDAPLRSAATGQTMQRDIVQFVPFREFASRHYSSLAKATLAEVPTQFLTWAKKAGVRPNPPPQVYPQAVGGAPIASAPSAPPMTTMDSVQLHFEAPIAPPSIGGSSG